MRKRKIESWCKIKEKEKKENLFATTSEIRAAFLKKQPMILFLYKEALMTNLDLDNSLPSVICVLFQEFTDVFPKEIPKGLLLIRGIEHQINFIPRVQIPNKPAYRSNPKETKEL